MLSVISAGWIWGDGVTGVTQPLHLPSHAVLRLVCLNLITLRLHCPVSCVVSKKMFDISVCFSLFQIVQVIFLVSSCFHFLLLVFFYVKLFQVLLGCCGKCYLVCHGFICCVPECLKVIFWRSLMVWRFQFAVGRFIWFRIVWSYYGSFKMFGVFLVCLGSLQIFSLFSGIWICYLAFRCFPLFQDAFLLWVWLFCKLFFVYFLEVIDWFYRVFWCSFGGFNFCGWF